MTGFWHKAANDGGSGLPVHTRLPRLQVQS